MQKKAMDSEIECFQKQLKNIMKMFGVTEAKLAEKLGVSRTQINNIKHCRCKMTKAQYIAIMVILTNSEQMILERIRLKIGFAKVEAPNIVRIF